MDAARFDICDCGDYRHQHDSRGRCQVCVSAGPSACGKFRVARVMTPSWRRLSRRERAIARRA